MKYLTIAPDYTGSCIQDDLSGPVDLKDLGLPKKFIESIENWHKLYRSIIPLSDKDRKLRMSEIEMLDKQGLYLAEQLQYLVPEGAKVRYFSEGTLKYLR